MGQRYGKNNDNIVIMTIIMVIVIIMINNNTFFWLIASKQLLDSYSIVLRELNKQTNKQTKPWA